MFKKNFMLHISSQQNKQPSAVDDVQTFKLELDFKETQIPKKWSVQCHSKVSTQQTFLCPGHWVILPCEAGLGNIGRVSFLFHPGLFLSRRPFYIWLLLGSEYLIKLHVPLIFFFNYNTVFKKKGKKKTRKVGRK